MAYRGIFTPRNPAKYLGDPNQIVYRSSWERGFMRYCDDTPGILKWASEEFFIPYVSPVDGQLHRYFPDFFLEVQSATGRKKMVVEIKPAHQTSMPSPKSRKTRKFLAEVATFAVNQAKWAAAKEFCLKQGMEFVVLTEHELFQKKVL
jgi:hypothetical protein